MLSSAIYPTFDPRLPAGLSRRVAVDELRARLGFAGVTITDDLAANGLRPFGSLERRAMKAARAGTDLLLVANRSPAAGASVVSALTDALQDGRVSRPFFERSAARVLELRAALSRCGGSGAASDRFSAELG